MTSTAYRSSDGSVTASGTSFVVNSPAGATTDDAIFVFMATQDLAAVLTPPTGFTLDADVSDTVSGLGLVRLLAYKKTGTGSEPSTYTFTSSVSMDASMASIAYSGTDTALIDTFAVAQHAGTAGFTFSAPATPANRAPEVVLTVFAFRDTTSTEVPAASTPTGNTLRQSAGTAFHSHLVVSDFTVTSRGPIPAKSAAFSGMLSETAVIALTVSLLVPDAAPNAPATGAPATGAGVNKDVTQRFTWVFSDPDSGDSQSAFDLRYSSDGGTTWTTISGTTPNNFLDVAGGTFGVHSYEWQVRTYDSQGLVGPYSSSSFFAAAAGPAGPTITYPTSGATVNQVDEVIWSYTTQQAFEVRRVADIAGVADPTTIYSDTLEVDTTARSLGLTFPVNGRTEHIQVRVESGGIWSGWTDVTVDVSYTGPPVADVTITTNPDEGNLSLTYTTPAPTGSVPPAVYSNIYASTDGGTTPQRLATMLPISNVWTFQTPASNTDYLFQVGTVAANGVESFTDWVDIAVIDEGTPDIRPPLVPGGAP